MNKINFNYTFKNCDKIAIHYLEKPPIKIGANAAKSAFAD